MNKPLVPRRPAPYQNPKMTPRDAPSPTGPDTAGTAPARSAIFISNNGLADHIGKAQVLPYLSGLAAQGHAIRTLTVETRENWADPDQTADITNAPLTRTAIWRKPGRLNRLSMPFRLSHRLDRMIRAQRPDLLHCRSYMPLAATLTAARRHDLPMIFDMRGFWIDQRIEGGFWSPDTLTGRLLIRRFRQLESAALARSAAIVVLTQDAKEVVQSHPAYRGAPIAVIPCSVDQSHFRYDPALRAETRAHMGIADGETVVTYLGSASGLYRMDLVYRFYDALRARKGPCRLLLIGNHDPVHHTAQARATGIPLTDHELICTRVPHAQVPALLNAADMGLSFIVSTPSSLGVSATKVGEYLACGLPVVSNTGIGDITRILTEGQNGAVLQSDDAPEITRAATLLAAPFNRAAIKSAAAPTFALDRAVDSYAALYQQVTA